MKLLKHKNFTIIFDFLTEHEIAIFSKYFLNVKWQESHGDKHFSNNINSLSYTMDYIDYIIIIIFIILFVLVYLRLTRKI